METPKFLVHVAFEDNDIMKYLVECEDIQTACANFPEIFKQAIGLEFKGIVIAIEPANNLVSLIRR